MYRKYKLGLAYKQKTRKLPVPKIFIPAKNYAKSVPRKKENIDF